MFAFPSVLSLTRWLVLLSLLGAGVLTLELAARIFSVGRDPEVRLALATTRPELFGFWHEMEQGFQSGQTGQPRPEREVRPTLRMAAGPAFELAADPATPILRYHEPSAAKRVALLALGALPGSESVAGLLLLGLGGWLLLQLLRDVTPETPFTPANARRLLHLSLLLSGLYFWDYLARVAVLGLVPAFRAPGVAYALNQYVRLNTDELVPGFLAGLMLFIVAAVYQRGVALSQESELVI